MRAITVLAIGYDNDDFIILQINPTTAAPTAIDIQRVVSGFQLSLWNWTSMHKAELLQVLRATK